MYPVLDMASNLCKEKLVILEENYKSDVISIKGPMEDTILDPLTNIVERLVLKNKYENKKIYVILTTNGGSAHTVKRMVNILRHNYDEVNFIIPDYAYSAGTILCMSGDNILMDYISVLGPIDPQVQNKEGRFVPALGYLDKVSELLEKAEKNTISEAEFWILKDFDLAELRAYEQASALTVDLLTEWLVQYKFKDWNKHSDGSEVTSEEKISKAKEIARNLGDSSKWKSHGRPLNIKDLESIGLKIQDYSKKSDERSMIREYYSVFIDYLNLINAQNYINDRFGGRL